MIVSRLQPLTESRLDHDSPQWNISSDGNMLCFYFGKEMFNKQNLTEDEGWEIHRLQCGGNAYFKGKPAGRLMMMELPLSIVVPFESESATITWDAVETHWLSIFLCPVDQCLFGKTTEEFSAGIIVDWNHEGKIVSLEIIPNPLPNRSV